MLTNLIPTIIAIPVIGLILILLLNKKWERTIFNVAISAIILEFFSFALLVGGWLNRGGNAISLHAGELFKNADYTFDIAFYFDYNSAIFYFVTLVLTTLVFVFSRTYLHREPGFKRFYATVLAFLTGLALIIFAGNFEVLLIGWELIGISSVLLIAFYRDRFLPARNSLKVFSVYRIADVFLLASIWYAHHLFEGSVNFADFAHVAAEHGNQMTTLGILILITALIKSAQFPFSYWLPRAMEGPTSSSAIFYGAISVHMGLFLLLRTFTLWEDDVILRIIIGIFGLTTAIVASSITRAQSTIKTQIAYASITQIGIMFIEIALGLPWLALIHFVTNASLRTYQLLISPSVVGYLIHEQFFTFEQPKHLINNSFLGRARATSYVLGIKEWNMDAISQRALWAPLKAIGRQLQKLDKPAAQLTGLVVFVVFAVTVINLQLTNTWYLISALVASVVSLALFIRAYSTKRSAITSWNLVAIGHLFGALFLGLASKGNWQYITLYSAGIIIAYVVGYTSLHYLRTKGEKLSLRNYGGAMYTYRKLGHLFFIACLLFMAFPISPTFLAQDILLSLIEKDNFILMILFGASYLLLGVSVMRIYTKTFFGPQELSHEVAYRSS